MHCGYCPIFLFLYFFSIITLYCNVFPLFREWTVTLRTFGNFEQTATKYIANSPFKCIAVAQFGRSRPIALPLISECCAHGECCHLLSHVRTRSVCSGGVTSPVWSVSQRVQQHEVGVGHSYSYDIRHGQKTVRGRTPDSPELSQTRRRTLHTQISSSQRVPHVRTRNRSE